MDTNIFNFNLKTELLDDILSPNKVFKQNIVLEKLELSNILKEIFIERNEKNEINLTVAFVSKVEKSDVECQATCMSTDSDCQTNILSTNNSECQTILVHSDAECQYEKSVNDFAIQCVATCKSMALEAKPIVRNSFTEFDRFLGTSNFGQTMKPDIADFSAQQAPETVSVRIQNCPITKNSSVQSVVPQAESETQCLIETCDYASQFGADMIDNEMQHTVEQTEVNTMTCIEVVDGVTQVESLCLVDKEIQCEPPIAEVEDKEPAFTPVGDTSMTNTNVVVEETLDDKSFNDEVLDEYGMKTRHTQTEPVTFIGGNIAIRGKLNIKQVIVEKSPNKPDSPVPTTNNSNSNARGRGRGRSRGATYGRKSNVITATTTPIEDEDDYVPPPRIKQENVYGKRQRARTTQIADLVNEKNNFESEDEMLIDENKSQRGGGVLTRGAGIKTRGGGVKRYTLSSEPPKTSLVGRRVNPRPDTSRPVPVPTLSEPSDNGFSCPFCTFRYQNSSELYGHLQIEHGKDRRYVGLNKKRPNCSWEEHQAELEASIAEGEPTEVSEEDLYSLEEPAVKRFKVAEEIAIESIDESLPSGFISNHCPLCNQKMSNWLVVYKHLNRVHLDHEDYEKVKLKLEEMCPELIEKEFLEQEAETMSTEAVVQEEEVAEEEEDLQKKGDYVCELCDRIFWSENRFIQHQKTHNNQSSSSVTAAIASKAHKCQYCDRTFQHSENLKRHVSTVHERSKVKRCVCDQCGKTFNYQMNLQEHIMSAHRQKQPYSCDKCAVGFVRRKDMLSHTCNDNEEEFE